MSVNALVTVLFYFFYFSRLSMTSRAVAPLYEDISVEEECNLPLPDGWIRVVKYLGERNEDGLINNLTTRVYKNLNSSQESFEHPLIAKALSKARKMPLPSGWQLVREIIHNKEECFYVNPEFQLSMWDPPLLRNCLANILRQAGLDSSAAMIESGISQEEQHHKHEETKKYYSGITNSFSPFPSERDRPETPEFESDPCHQASFFPDNNEVNNLIDDLPSFTESPIFQLRTNHGFFGSHTDSKPENQFLDQYPLPEESDEEMKAGSQSPVKKQPLSKQQHGEQDRNWQNLLQTFREPILEFKEKASHRVTDIPPPMTFAGIKILKGDLKEGNDRVHQLIMKLRALLAERAGYECKFLYLNKENEKNRNPEYENEERETEDEEEREEEKQKSNEIITLASDLITLIKQHPDYVIMALSNRNLIQSLEMLEIAYIVIHRILHPFSTDNSMTTALLLQSINYQLEELSEVEQIFSTNDSKLIISRALFIHNAKKAVEWNGLYRPFPLVPNVNRETVFSCLMRVYSLRRDITGYFRAIWKPLLPSITALFTSSSSLSSDSASSSSSDCDLSNPLLFINLLTLAHRFLTITFHEKSMTVFPVIATAICRAIYEIANEEALLTFLFNYLILPNFIKIVCGDHDSLENEEIHSLENISKVINRYYDQRWWFIKDENNGENENSSSSSPNASSSKNKKEKASKRSSSSTSFGKNEESKTTSSSSAAAAATIETMDVNEKSLKIIRSFIFLFWKLFSCSTYLSDSAITALTIPEFLSGHLSFLSFTGYSDSKLRNLITRLKGKLHSGCNWLSKMPLDAQGSEYLGISQELTIENLSTHQHQQQTYELFDRRKEFLLFKPNEILNLTILSKKELCLLLNDIAVAIEFVHNNNSNNKSNDRNDVVTSEGNGEIEENHPIYPLIISFLSIYNEPTHLGNDGRKKGYLIPSSHQTEEFLQLTFLYDKGEGDADEPLSMDEEYLAYEYRQLLRGLKLTNRYEDTLLNLINKVEKGILSNIYELLAESNQLWYLEPEFDIEFKVNHIKIAEKQKNQTKNKKKKPVYGLRKELLIKIFPLFSQHNGIAGHDNDIHDRNRVSLASLQSDVIASYRFGSAQRSVDVGTSLARQMVLPPKLALGQVKVVPSTKSESSNRTNPSNRSDSNNNRQRSIFTEPTIKNSSSILAPTKSFFHSKAINKRKDKPTLQEKDQSFMKSMRTHNVIPTHEFQMRYFLRKRRNTHNLPNINQRTSPERIRGGGNQIEDPSSPYHQNSRMKKSVSSMNSAKAVSTAAATTIAPKPFPEHLRNRIRGNNSDPVSLNSVPPHQYDDLRYISEDGYEQYEEREEREEEHQQRGRKSNQVLHEDSNMNKQEQHKSSWKYEPNFFQSLISDYESTVKPLKQQQQQESLLSNLSELNINTNFSRQLSYQSQPSPSHSRSRSPSASSNRNPPRMPSPALDIPHSLLSPTKSVANRFKSISERNDEPTAEFMRDVAENKPPELRKYKNEPELVSHPEPFRLTKSKVYAPTGSRIPRVPEFLEPIEGEDVVYSNPDSRAASPHYRGRSRSTSPASSRSRSRSGSRSGSGSYLRPTLSSLNARSDRAIIREQDVQQERPVSVRKDRIEDRKSNHPLNDHDFDDSPRESETLPVPVVNSRPLKLDDLAGSGHQQQQVPEAANLSHSSTSQQVSEPVHHSPTITVPKKKVDSHKFSFAEALANASKEAAEQHRKQQLDSKYSFAYFDDNSDTGQNRNKVNLNEDRETVLKQKLHLFQPREWESEDDEELETDDKLLEFSPSATTPKSRKSIRFKGSSDETKAAEGKSPSRIPIVRKKSFIADEKENREMFLQGFVAIKVSDLLSIIYLLN
jgi:hypothetical protein